MKNVNMIIKRGMIFYADLGEVKNVNGSEQGGKRPVIVIQNDMGNRFAPTTVVACMTSKMGKSNLPTHVFVKRNQHNNLEKNSLVLCEQIKTISKNRLVQYVGAATEETMKKIDKAIDISINFDKEKELEKEAENSQLISTIVTLKRLIKMWIDKTGNYEGMENELRKYQELKQEIEKKNLVDSVQKFEEFFNNPIFA